MSNQGPHVGRGGKNQQEKGEASCVVRSKPSNKGSGRGTAASLDREPRWTEQLLNPCVTAMEAGKLGELASSGEPNHRLSTHGLRPHATPLARRGRSSCGDHEDVILRVPDTGVLRRRPAPILSLAHQVQRLPGAAPRVAQAWSIPGRAGGAEAEARARPLASVRGRASQR